MTHKPKSKGIVSWPKTERPLQDLLKAPGLDPAKVAQIKAAFELGKKVCAGKLTATAFELSLAIAA